MCKLELSLVVGMLHLVDNELYYIPWQCLALRLCIFFADLYSGDIVWDCLMCISGFGEM